MTSTRKMTIIPFLYSQCCRNRFKNLKLISKEERNSLWALNTGTVMNAESKARVSRRGWLSSWASGSRWSAWGQGLGSVPCAGQTKDIERPGGQLPSFSEINGGLAGKQRKKLLQLKDVDGKVNTNRGNSKTLYAPQCRAVPLERHL